MELKFDGDVYYGREAINSNRTFMELKYLFALIKLFFTFDSNRTFMELK